MKNLQLFLEQAKVKKTELDGSQSEFEKTQAQLAGDSKSGTLDSPEGRDFTISARERYLNSTKERRERKEQERIEREKEKIAAEKAAEKEAEKQELRDIRDDIKTQKQELKKALATEVYDPEMGTVRGPRAKRSAADRRKPGTKPRVKAVGGGKTAPVDYKPQGEKPNRSGNNKTSNTTQQPTKERGSAEVKQSYADEVKAKRRAAAKARAAAKKSGGEVKTTKTSAKDATKAADKLLSTKKKETVSPDYKPAKASGYNRRERNALTGKGERMLRGIMKDQETKKYRDATGTNPDAKGRQKILGRVNKRMST